MSSDALRLRSYDISIIPCDPETKRPSPSVGEWGRFRSERPTEEEVKKLFVSDYAIAAICGPVSGNLEVIDFDEPGLIKQWHETLKSWNCKPLFDRLLIEESRTAGRYHAIYRHAGPPEGNQKLALTEDGQVRIETRGDGGYCIVSPSRGYTVVRGAWESLPTISAEEREALLAAARSFDLSPPEQPSKHREEDRDTVWGDYNARAPIDEILTPLGWVRGPKHYWLRPGKEKGTGWSATWDYQGRGLFHVFSSNCGIECRSYDKFGLYAWLHHGGDFAEATRAAAKSGYGLSPDHKATERNDSVPERASVRPYFGVDRQEVEWLWPPYIPLGGCTILCGDPGVGKSTFAYNLSAMVTNGYGAGGYPDQEPGSVLLYCLEDDASKVIRGRLEEFGADLSKVYDGRFDSTHNPEGIEQPMTIAKMESILKTAESMPDLKLVVFDPISEWFPPDKSMSSSNEARSILKIFRRLAEVANCAVLLLGHPNKSTQSTLMYRLSGSIDFSAIVRSVLYAAKVPDIGESAVIHAKCNWGPIGRAIGYKIEDDGSMDLTGMSDISEDMLSRDTPTAVSSKEVEHAKDWLEQMLADGPAKTDECFQQARSQGISAKALQKAKQGMADVRAKRISGEWYWVLEVWSGY